MANDLLSAAEARKRLDELHSTPAPQAPAMFRRAEPGEGMWSPPTGPATTEWSPGKYLGGSIESLIGAGKDIREGVGNLVGSFFNAIVGGAATPRMGPPTPQGRAAGSEVMGKLSDIGTFASGGLAGSMGTPLPTRGPRMTPRAATMGPVVGGALDVAEGLGRGPQPPVPPRPQLALPPPRETPMPSPGGPQPWGARPQPGAATAKPQMTAPEAGPVPQAAFRPQPSAPPRTSTLTQDPMVHPADRLGDPSMTATMFVQNNPEIAARMRKLPGRPGSATTERGIALEDQRWTTAFDTMIETRNSLRLTDTKGNALPAGRLPNSLRELNQGLDHLMGQVYTAYDQMSQRVGAMGVKVPLQPAIDRIRQLVNDPALRLDPSGATRNWAEAQAQAWEREGPMSPKEMQGYIKSLDRKYAGHIPGVAGDADLVSRNEVMAEVVRTLRNSLNSTMETALGGPQFQILRNRYGMLTELQKDIGNAVRLELSRKVGRGVIEQAADYGAVAGLAAGVAHLHPVSGAATAATIEATKWYTRILNNPNQAVRQMFNSQLKARNPPPQPILPELSSRIASGYWGPPAPPRETVAPYIGPSGL